MSRTKTAGYQISTDEADLLTERADEVVSRFESGDVTSQDLTQIGRLLKANESNFDAFQDRPWFKKAWILVTGERGRLVDQSVANLGKVQVGVIKILDTLLQKDMEVKEDILRVFERLDVIENDSREIKHFLLKFNEKHKDRYNQLRRELGRTRNSVQIGLAGTGATFLVIAGILGVPGLAEWQTEIGMVVFGIAAVVLLGRAGYSYWKSDRSEPIQTQESGGAPAAALPAGEDFQRTEALLGIGDGDWEEEEKDRRIFKIDGTIADTDDYFQLSNEEQRLLFSIQRYLVEKDILLSPKKRNWQQRWTDSIERSIDGELVTDQETLFQGLQEIRDSSLPDPKIGTLLLEVRLFEPYYPLDEGDEEFTDQYDEASHREGDHEFLVAQIAQELGFSVQQLDDAYQAFETAIDEIPPSPIWKRVWVSVATAILLAVTGGTLAPVIGGAIGAAFGLSGAAAVSSGLAFLGGGALAAGGLGMAGGTAVVIGGGAVLGAGIGGSGAVSLLSKDKTLMLRELAKLEAITKTFLVHLPDPRQAVSSVINKVEVTRKSLERKSNSMGKKEGKEAKASAQHCERFVERLRKFARSAPW